MTQPTSAPRLRGSCLCGDVAFECVGPPLHFNLCHCTMCQKFHGAMLGPYVWFREEQFTLMRGAETVYASSAWASRSFCRRCGSSLRYLYHKEPDLVFIAAGAFDDDLGVTPERHIFVKDKCGWFEILDGLPQVASWVGSDAEEP